MYVLEYNINMRIELFRTPNNKEPFEEWIKSLSKSVRLKVYKRLSRVEEGNFKYFKSLKGGYMN